MTDIQMQTPFGIFTLYRVPRRSRELLRAWDAADEYLLQQLALGSAPVARPLICNDSFGALSVALHHNHPLNWSDSWMAHQAARENLVANGFDVADVDYLSSLELPATTIDLALIKVPKTMALLEYQLIKLKPLLSSESRVMVAGMAKSMPASLWKMLERVIGPARTLRALKKAKLIHVSVDMQLALPKNPYPVTWPLEGTDFTLTSHANVFSREKLDIGTRFLLQHLPQTEGQGDIMDLGCGNGVLGLIAASQNSAATLHFVDESYMAIQSARENFKQVSVDSGRATFHVSDDLGDFEDESIDLVLCNPPFHQQATVGDALAMSMFRESARVLKPQAELWVVGNRHLDYHQKLKKWFDRVEVAASNSKFVILKATTSGRKK